MLFTAKRSLRGAAAAVAAMTVAITSSGTAAAAEPQSSTIVSPTASVTYVRESESGGITHIRTVTETTWPLSPKARSHGGESAQPFDIEKKCEDDSTDSVSQCVVQDYDEYAPGSGAVYVSINYYSIRWTNEDGTGLIGIKNGDLLVSDQSNYCRYHCGSTKVISDYHHTKKSSPAFDTTYKYTPSYKGKYFEVTDDSVQYACAVGKVTVTRYSKSWTLQGRDVCQGSPHGGIGS
jgi:hypothetical protein